MSEGERTNERNREGEETRKKDRSEGKKLLNDQWHGDLKRSEWASEGACESGSERDDPSASPKQSRVRRSPEATAGSATAHRPVNPELTGHSPNHGSRRHGNKPLK